MRFRHMQFLLAGCAVNVICATAMAQQLPVDAANALVTPAEAQVGPSDTPADIVVTAQKRSQRLSDVPVSITALTGTQLADLGINDVFDLVKVTPGLTVADNQGRGGPVISLRGVGFYDFALGARPTVSVYIDEAPIPFTAEAQAAAFDLERVEILKGPQGTLFGQSSTGGAINYIAAKPTETFQAGVTARYGRFDQTDVQAYISGPIAPALNARLAIHTQQSSDWQYSYTRNDSLGSQNFTQARLLLDWKPADRLSITLNLNGFYDGSDNQAAQYIGVKRPRPTTPLINNYPLPPQNPRAADWDPNQDFGRNNKFYQAILRGEYKLSDAVALTSLTSYSHEHVNSLIDVDGTALQNFTVRDVGTLETFSQEVRASGDFGPLHYLTGVNYEYDKTNELAETLTAYNVIANTVGADAGTISGQKFSTIAVFGDATYRISDKFGFTAGARYTKQNLDYNGCLVTLNQSSAATYTAYLNTNIRVPANLGPIAPLAVGQCASLDASRNPAQAIGALNEHNISWRAVLDFKPARGTLFYASVSKGYKAGSTTTPGASSVDQFLPVTQESVLAFETGVKSSLFDRLLDLTAAAFYNDYRNKQLLGRNVFTPNIFGAQAALVNIPKSRVLGAETQLTLYPIKGISLSAAATYIDSKVKGDFFNYDLLGALANFKGNAFPYTPKWQLVFGSENRVRVSSSLFSTFGWNATYRSSTVSGFGDDPRLKIDSYWLAEVRLGIEPARGKWKANIYGRNIFNQYYATNVASSGDTIRRITGMPATYGVQVNYKF